jgi:hypothetical protein
MFKAKMEQKRRNLRLMQRNRVKDPILDEKMKVALAHEFADLRPAKVRSGRGPVQHL